MGCREDGCDPKPPNVVHQGRHSTTCPVQRIKRTHAKGQVTALILGVSQRPTHSSSRHTSASLSAPLSLQLCFAERTTSHGPSGPTRCHTCQDHPCLPVKRRRGSTTCTHNATTFRERRHLGTHTHGSLHTSGRGCASREGHTNTLPALPLRAAQRDKRGRRTHAAAPQQHGAPIPSRTARTN